MYFITFCCRKVDRKSTNYVVCTNFAQAGHSIGLALGIGALDGRVKGYVVLARQTAHSSTLSIFGNGLCPSGTGSNDLFVVPGASRLFSGGI